MDKNIDSWLDEAFQKTNNLSEEENKKIDKMLEDCLFVRSVITEKHGKEKPEEFICEVMECPLCKNQRT